MPDPPIMLSVTDDYLAACDVSVMEKMFGDHILPREAKAAFSRVYLVFPKYDKDPREVWEIDEVRAWIRRLAERVPHFPYFLVSDASAGQTLMCLLALIPARSHPSGQIEFDMIAARREIAIMRSALETYCVRIRESFAAVWSVVLNSLPEPLRD